MKTGIIAKPSAWLYGKNKTDRTDELLFGWAVGILAEMDGWLEIVTHYGYRGFLRKEDMSIRGSGWLRDRDANGQTIFINRPFADVLEAPRAQGRILAALSKGSFLSLLPETRDGYQKVALSDGREGYIPCIAYERRRENDGYLYQEAAQDYFLRQDMASLPSESEFRGGLVTCAKSYLGAQYRWGGKSAEGIDCSGLTFMSYLMNGVIIYRDAVLKNGYPIHEISLSRAKSGDLLYFPGHIAMYLGKNKYIHATGNKKNFGCVINSLSSKDADYRKDLAEMFLTAGSIF